MSLIGKIFQKVFALSVLFVIAVIVLVALLQELFAQKAQARLRGYFRRDYSYHGYCSAALETASAPGTGVALSSRRRQRQSVQDRKAARRRRSPLLGRSWIFSFVLERLTYEAAVAIASAGEGQTSLFYGDDASKAWETFGLDVAGEAIGALSDLVGEELDFEFNLCAPKVPEGAGLDAGIIKLGLQVGIRQAYQPQKPRCDFQEIKANWEGFVGNAVQSIKDPQARNAKVLSAFAEGLRPGQNEMEASIQLYRCSRESINKTGYEIFGTDWWTRI